MKPSFDKNPAKKAAEKQAFGAYAGKRLRVVRNKMGYTQEQLSEKAGYYRTYVGHIETGNHSPSLHTMWRLAHAMGIDLGELLKGL